MAGGTFTPGVSKTRPGFYVNFESASKTQVDLSTRGIVLLPLLSAKYGPLKTFIHLYNDNMDGELAKLGYSISDAEMLLVKEAFKRAKEVILYIPATGGAAATASVAPLTVTAKYVGTRGNSFKTTIVVNPISGFDVTVLLGTQVVFFQEKVATVADLLANNFVTFSGTGSLVASAGVSLTAGTNPTTANLDVTDFLDASEIQVWNTLCFPSTDASLIASFDSKVKYFNNDIGKYCVGVRPKASVAANSEFIITLNNGVILSTGETLTPLQASAWYAGASAAANVTEDLTYQAYENAIDANPRLKDSDIKTALKAGEIVFTVSGSSVIVEEDINSLTTLTTSKDEAYTDNRVIRTLHEIAISGATILLPNKYSNDTDGMQLAKQDLITILTTLQDLEAIKNVDVDSDVVIDVVKSVGKSLYANVAVQPTRTYKKYYIAVKTA